MGRPPIGAKPTNAAERRPRKRKRLRAERRAASKQKREGDNVEPKLPLAAQADQVALKIANTLNKSPDLSIDDIRAAIDRRWPKLPIGHQGRAGGKASEVT